MQCCFMSAAASTYGVRVLAFKAVSHIRVTMEASEPVERKRLRNMKMFYGFIDKVWIFCVKVDCH